MFPVAGAPLLHLLLETAGVALAMAYYHRLRERHPDPISDHHRTLLLIAAAFGAFLGSRLVGALEQPQHFLENLLRSKTIVGGLLGGLFTVEATKALLGIRHRSGDIYVFPLLTAMIVGRIGCFLMGVGEPTHGLPTTTITGMDLGDGLHRHPTSLYEIVFLSVLFWAGTQVQRKWRIRPGRLFMLFLTSYLGYRFLVGFVQPGERFAALTSIQWACLLGLGWYVVDEWVSSRSPSTSPHAGR